MALEAVVDIFGMVWYHFQILTPQNVLKDNLTQGLRSFEADGGCLTLQKIPATTAFEAIGSKQCLSPKQLSAACTNHAYSFLK